MSTLAPPSVQGDPSRAPLSGGFMQRAGSMAVRAGRFAARARARRIRRSVVGSGSLTMVAVAALGVVVQLLGVGALQQGRDQHVLYDRLRADLANGVTPVGPVDFNGDMVKPGSPVALLEIPRLHLRQVVLQGTTSSVTAHGPGHRPDSVMPGQPGVSLLLGRAVGYGGPFRHLVDLRAGDTLTVTTGQGPQSFTVLGPRRAGDVAPPLGLGESRLTMETADGPALLPIGIVRVDAALTSPVQDGATPVSTASIGAAQKPMGSDFSHVFALVLWLELLIVVALFTVWSRTRWGRWQTWLAAGPVLLFLGVVVADHVTQLLPNLL